MVDKNGNCYGLCNFNNKLYKVQHVTAILVEPWTVGTSVDTILVFDTLTHRNFQMDKTTGLNIIMRKINLKFN